jgi:3-oxoacyl-[acyl-carrier protein] reductase
VSDGRVQGRVAIVTGAGRGIGRGIAEVFAREGARILVADLNEDGGRRACRELEEHFGAETAFAAADIARPEDVERVVREAIDRFGRIDVLCHNAGIYPESWLGQMSTEEWDRVLDVNLKAAFLLVQACAPHMQAQGGGKIVFTASITGPVTVIPRLAHYAASKAGLVGFTRAAALELATSNINVNAVLPGNILTPGVEELGEEYIRAQEARIPMGHLGEPLDIGHAMLFLASDEARYITGQTIIVDGGQTLPEA